MKATYKSESTPRAPGRMQEPLSKQAGKGVAHLKDNMAETRRPVSMKKDK